MAGLILYRCSPPPPPGFDLLFITSSVSPLYYSLGLNASRRSSSHQVEASKLPGQSVISPLTDCRLSLRRRRCQVSAAWRLLCRCVRRRLSAPSLKIMVPLQALHSAAVTWMYKCFPDGVTVALPSDATGEDGELDLHCVVLFWFARMVGDVMRAVAGSVITKHVVFAPPSCVSFSRIWFKGPGCVDTIDVTKAWANDHRRLKIIHSIKVQIVNLNLLIIIGKSLCIGQKLLTLIKPSGYLQYKK